MTGPDRPTAAFPSPPAGSAHPSRTGNAAPPLEPVDIDLLVADLVRDMRGSADRLGIEVAVANASTALVAARPSDLRWALMLLLTTILECTQRGGTVRVAFHDLRGWVDVSVHAAPCPLLPELLEALAEPAWIDGRSRRGACYQAFHDVRRLIQAMDGHVRVSGGNPVTTTITVSLDMALAPHLPRTGIRSWWSAAVRAVRHADTPCREQAEPAL